MHQEAYELMQSFAEELVKPGVTVADLGACDVNGTFRPLFAACAYTGLDVEEGPNVDRVIEHYDFGPDRFDVVVSGNTIEHVQDMQRWVAALLRICKPGALVCVIAPHTCGEHRFPIDCWRIFPDGMRWLFRDARGEILSCDAFKRDTRIVLQVGG